MITAAIKKLELNGRKVAQHTARKKRRVLFKQGAYLRTTMQRSMRYSDKPSKPGKPPHARRKRPLLRNLTEFAVDERAESVVAGPKILAGSKVRSSRPLPELLDGGGTISIELQSGASVSAAVKPRPFTAPVFTDGGENFRKLISKEPF